MSLLYAAGHRPGADEVARLLQATAGESGQLARISHRPADSEGCLEVLASGLTFDLAGLDPAPAITPPPGEHRFGLAADFADQGLEAVVIVPGAHIASGAAMIPVIRVMAGLALRLVNGPDLRAVAWGPAKSWMEPAYFRRIVEAWLAGAAFPVMEFAAPDQAENEPVLPANSATAA